MVRWCHALFVLQGETCTKFDQVLYGLIFICLDGIEDRSLIFGVSVVKQRSKRNELLNGANVTLSGCIVDWGLAILVLSVH